MNIEANSIHVFMHQCRMSQGCAVMTQGRGRLKVAGGYSKGWAFQLPRVIEGGVGVNDSREFEFYPGVALAARGGWALHQGQVV